MKDILVSASYVQNRDAIEAEAMKRTTLESICREDGQTRRIWELLETPQTLGSLSRHVAHESGTVPEACTEPIKVSLAKLYREDLIQLSPDT